MKNEPKNLAVNFENLRRLDRILAKMRRAGISEEDIEWLGDFWQADVLHVVKLTESSAKLEQEKLAVN